MEDKVVDGSQEAGEAGSGFPGPEVEQSPGGDDGKFPMNSKSKEYKTL
jgi:hypothetical protein